MSCRDRDNWLSCGLDSNFRTKLGSFFAFLLTNYDFKMSIGQKGNPVAFPRGASAVNVAGEGLFDIININEVDEKW